jgi:FKBP-type peptidyl-prolyl cis-trans isomerase (trigger factor)
MSCEYAEEELLELQEEFAQRLGQADRTIQELRDDKAKLQQQLQEANKGGSATEAKVSDMEDTIERLRCTCDAA